MLCQSHCNWLGSESGPAIGWMEWFLQLFLQYATRQTLAIIPLTSICSVCTLFCAQSIRGELSLSLTQQQVLNVAWRMNESHWLRRSVNSHNRLGNFLFSSLSDCRPETQGSGHRWHLRSLTSHLKLCDCCYVLCLPSLCLVWLYCFHMWEMNNTCVSRRCWRPVLKYMCIFFESLPNWA